MRVLRRSAVSSVVRVRPVVVDEAVAAEAETGVGKLLQVSKHPSGSFEMPFSGVGHVTTQHADLVRDVGARADRSEEQGADHLAERVLVRLRVKPQVSAHGHAKLRV